MLIAYLTGRQMSLYFVLRGLEIANAISWSVCA